MPLRFYPTLQEQDRFKTHVVGVSFIDLNYVHADCRALIPFQIAFVNAQLLENIEWSAVCVDTGDEISLVWNNAKWEQWYDTEKGQVYVSYLGSDDLDGLGNGKYYLKVTFPDAYPIRTFYSDEFIISNCASPADISEYRRWNNDTDLRKINVNDLRITK